MPVRAKQSIRVPTMSTAEHCDDSGAQKTTTANALSPARLRS